MRYQVLEYSLEGNKQNSKVGIVGCDGNQGEYFR